jgi:hypothetical protein
MLLMPGICHLLICGWGMQSRVSRKDRVAALGEDIEQVDWDLFVVKGTMQELEKSYFRLTSAPDPSTVRPEPVLRRAYERLVHLLRQGKQNYFYALDQFKGMRQDCTVQHLRNDLTVSAGSPLTLRSKAIAWTLLHAQTATPPHCCSGLLP